MDESEEGEPAIERPSDPDRFAWTASQRRVLIGLLLGLCCLMTGRYACNSRFVSDPQPQEPARGDELADRVDPNIVDWEVLAAIPGLGDKRAKEIVAYREDFKRDHPGRPAFKNTRDLLKIRGVGAAVANSMEAYLVFATTRPAPGN